VTTLRLQLGSNLWEKYSSATPSRVVVQGKQSIRASALAELYLLLIRWTGRGVRVAQDGVDLSALQQLGLGASWEGNPAPRPDLWVLTPGKTLSSDGTLDPLHEWLDRLRQPEPIRVAVEKVIVEAVDNAHEHSRTQRARAQPDACRAAPVRHPSRKKRGMRRRRRRPRCPRRPRRQS
jgi:hypothetical protein